MASKKPTNASRGPKFFGEPKIPLKVVSWDPRPGHTPVFEPKFEPLPSQSELERKRAYYQTHREKISDRKKEQVARQTAEVCKSKGLPVVLAPYIRFYEETRYLKDPVGLKFESIHEMLIFLKDVQTKGLEMSAEELADLIHRYNSQGQ